MTRFNRRTVLRGAGVGVALPFMESLLPRGARAMAATVPKRLIIYYQPEGILETFEKSKQQGTEQWFPSGSGSDFKLAPLSAAFEPFKDSLIMTRGISMNAGGDLHKTGTPKTLRAGGSNSIDVTVSEAIGAGTPFKLLQAGIGTEASGAVESRITFKGGSGVAPQPNPNNLFSMLFKGSATGKDIAGGTPTPTDMATREALHARNKSVLDFVVGELKAVQTRLGAADRKVLDHHTTSIRDLELELRKLNELATGAPPPASCASAKVDLSPIQGQSSWTGSRTSGVANLDKIAIVQQELAYLALRCDLTRAVTVHYLRSNSGQTFGFLPISARSTTQHRFAHDWWKNNGALYKDYRTVLTWRIKIFTDFVMKLKNTPEGTGSMLDNSLVVWATEMGDPGHGSANVPYLMVGKAGGTVKTNQFLRFSGDKHEGFLRTVVKAMGVDPGGSILPGFLNS